MSKRVGIAAGLWFTSALLAVSPGMFAPSQSRSVPGTPVLRPDANFGNIPLYFVPNRGQTDSRALFSACAAGFTLWATRDGLIFDQRSRSVTPGAYGPAQLSFGGAGSSGTPRPAQLSFGGAVTPGAYGPEPLCNRGTVTSLVFLGSRPDVEVSAEGETTHRANFILGQDTARWRTDIPTSSAVRYRGLYPGIDLKVYGSGRQVEYDWVVAPGADPAGIRFHYDGTRETRLDSEGNLIVDSPAGEIMHKKPAAYQEIDGRRIPVACRYERLDADTYGFRVGRYDRRRPLVIDPLVLVWSSFIGGDHAEYVRRIAVDAAGNVYITGYTESLDFPLADPLYPTLAGKADIFVAKIAPAGNALLYSTFIGGTGADYVYGLAVDGSGAAVIGGATSSRSFPIKAAYDPIYNGGSQDGYLLKISPAGDALVFSTYLGGKENDSIRQVVFDATGAIIVAGWTMSTNFPAVKGFDKSYNGQMDVFVAKFTAGGKSLVFSTFLGGRDFEIVYAIALDAQGRIHAAGGTESPDFPVKNALYAARNSGRDGFLTILSSTGNALAASTYIGGRGDESFYGLAVDSSGSIYLGGDSSSPDFPTRGAFDPVFNGDYDGVVLKLKPLASAIVFSTYLGGPNSDGVGALAVDAAGGVVVTGLTDSPEFPVCNAFDATLSGQWDAFVAKFLPSGRALAFSTFLGGANNEESAGLALDAAGGIYVCGGTDSKNFPRKSAFDTVYGGRGDGFVTKFRWR